MTGPGSESSLQDSRPALRPPCPSLVKWRWSAPRDSVPESELLGPTSVLSSCLSPGVQRGQPPALGHTSQAPGPKPALSSCPPPLLPCSQDWLKRKFWTPEFLRSREGWAGVQLDHTFKVSPGLAPQKARQPPPSSLRTAAAFLRREGSRPARDTQPGTHNQGHTARDTQPGARPRGSGCSYIPQAAPASRHASHTNSTRRF